MRTGAEYNEVVDNITRFADLRLALPKAERPKMNFNFILMRRTIAEAPKFVEMVHRWGGDEIVFNQGKKKQEGGQDTRVEGGPSEDKQLQALWLRRLDTRPADFLKAKFAFQAAQGEDPSP